MAKGFQKINSKSVYGTCRPYATNFLLLYSLPFSSKYKVFQWFFLVNKYFHEKTANLIYFDYYVH